MEINLKIDSNQIEASFSRIAYELMNQWILKVENSHYRITEIEFYFKSELHNDIFIHGHEMQKKSGRWYFHGSGLDLTFGSDDYFGGILIRAFYNLDTEEYIYGPLNIINEIFRKRSSIYLSDFSFGLFADVSKALNFEEQIRAPRVGLNPNNSPEMFGKFYRYLIMPKHKHAEKTKIAEAMRQQLYAEDKIKMIWG